MQRSGGTITQRNSVWPDGGKHGDDSGGLNQIVSHLVLAPESDGEPLKGCKQGNDRVDQSIRKLSMAVGCKA